MANKNLSDVKFTGRLGGEALSNAYKKADFFLFMSYGEGMPTVVLEAMAFGLPVFTRNVGGLVDFFENGRMGYISDSLNPVDFANAMKPYLENYGFKCRSTIRVEYFSSSSTFWLMRYAGNSVRFIKKRNRND